MNSRNNDNNWYFGDGQAGVSRQTIVAIEKGNYSPSLELVFRIAHIFKILLEEVFFYDPLKDKLKKKK